MKKKGHKYIFVVGGVMSGVGKGVTSSSIGTILKARGLAVTALKIDPYINVDAGTMNPTEHGEVFVLRDGLETDQDMGNYERFLDTDLPGGNYMTTGSVYLSVIEKERNLEYKGKNVEVVPDIPLEVIRRIEGAAKRARADVTITEIGGTVGEYQNILFLEAARMMKTKNPDDVAVVLVSYLPVPGSIGEMKTKPTQYAARSLNSAGVFADIIIARAPVALDDKRKEKIATFCNVSKENVISAPDVESIYDVPLDFEKGKLTDRLLHMLHLGSGRKKKADLSRWKTFTSRAKRARKTVSIAVVGKYFDTGSFVLSDAYISVIEAIKFSSYLHGAKPDIHWLNAKDFEKGKANVSILDKYDGIIVPGGFGESGIEGKLAVIKYAREHKIPYLGLCYGMQLATIEYARHALKLRDANTHEIDPDAKHLIVDIMPEQKKLLEKSEYGATMRLGSFPARVAPGTIAHASYSASEGRGKKSKRGGYKLVHERHRHRYEINPVYVERLERAGLVFSGRSPDGRLMEILELPKDVHPFFVGTQFHPELQARPLEPHPLFNSFIEACLAADTPERTPKKKRKTPRKKTTAKRPVRKKGRRKRAA